jgi:hypothetical protein
MSITNLYVNDRTTTSQILAYISVLDQDAAENGTVKSIDLSLINFKQPSSFVTTQRQQKLEQLRNYERLANITTNLDFESQINTNHQQPQIPVRLNKITNKLYTLQLVQKLNFKSCESYSIEMRILDNGTRPQLETKSRININILDNNQYAPVFLNINNRIEIVENLDYNATPVFKLNAVDLDDEKNGQLRYKIINNPFLDLVNKDLGEKEFNIEARSLLESTFSLNRETGELTLLRPLARELLLNDTIELHVIAQDQAEPQQNRKQAVFKLFIKLIDLNNNQPEFTTNKLNLAVDYVAQSEDKFTKVTSDVFLVDLDTYETNSARFLSEFSNQTNKLLNSIHSTAVKNSVSSVLDSKMFKFSDVVCYKSINLELVSSNLASLPFLVHVERDPNNSNSNHVTCRVSVWMDNEKFASLVNSSVDSFINYKFKLVASDNGVELTPTQVNNEEKSVLDLSIQVNRVSLVSSKLPRTIRIDLSNKTDSIELSPNGEMIDFELASCNQITQNTDSNTVVYVNATQKFRLVGTMLQFQIDSVNEGVYLIELYNTNANMARQLTRFEIIFYKTSLNLKQMNTLSVDFNSKLNKDLSNQHNVFINTKSLDANGLSLMKQLQNSFSSTLNQFQSLLFGYPKSSVDLMTLSSDQQLIYGNSGQSTPSTMFGVLFNNRSTFVKFIVVTMVLLFVILMLFVCCILLIIRRNCVRNREEKKKSLNSIMKNNNDHSSIQKTMFKNLNVHDDEDPVKLKAMLEDDNGGFTRLIVSQEQKNRVLTDEKFKFSEQLTGEVNEKVTRYLNCLDTTINSTTDYNQYVQNHQNDHVFDTNQISLQAKYRTNSDNNESEPNTSSPSSSVIDSKKNLIVPVTFVDGGKVTTTPAYVYSQKNSSAKKAVVSQTGAKTSVCTLSTTSSSCISDEGCYGSSDFSSEHERQLKQQKMLLNDQLILLNPNNIMKNQLIVSRTQTPILNSAHNANLKNYHSYLNNLSRFEKIYNNSSNNPNVSKTDSAMVIDSNSASSTSPNSIGSNPNMQIITAISGSYV